MDLRTCWLLSYGTFTRRASASCLRTWVGCSICAASAWLTKLSRCTALTGDMPVVVNFAKCAISHCGITSRVQVSSGGADVAERTSAPVGIWQSAGVWDAPEALERQSSAAFTWTEQSHGLWGGVRAGLQVTAANVSSSWWVFLFL